MREAGVKARYRRKFKVTTNSDHKQPVFDNVLARDFSAAESDQAYVGDITYIWTREGWLYLAVFIDVFSRRIVGWSMASRMNAKLVTDALTIAMVRMRSDPRTKIYVERRTHEGLSTNEIHRCLKRYIVRELFPLIMGDLGALAGAP